MRFACLFALLLSAVFTARSDDQDEPDFDHPCPGHGSFSCDSIQLDDFIEAHGSNPSIIPSPDGSKRIVIVPSHNPDLPGKVWVEMGSKKFSTMIGYHLNGEVSWAPDSGAFVETHSEGGAVGDYVVYVYYVSQSGLRVSGPRGNVDPTKLVVKDFMNYPILCGGPREEPNVAAVRWGEDSRTLFVAAEILPHSYCDSMGTFRLYKIALPKGRILARWGQLEAKREFWSSLGVELRNADDDCILDPASCYVPNNHAECFPTDEEEKKRMPSYCSKVLETVDSPD
jgi:hypothetical protein